MRDTTTYITRRLAALLFVAGTMVSTIGFTRPEGTAGAADARGPADAQLPADPSAAGPAVTSTGSPSFASERASFSVQFRDIVTPYKVFLLTAVPGEDVRLSVLMDGPMPGSFAVEATAGMVVRADAREWVWHAPEQPGTYRITLRPKDATKAADVMTLNAVVMIPMARNIDGRVHGYRVGDFPQEPYRELPQYLPPRGFIPLTPEGDLQVSPHFSLSQFPCKGPDGYPKYVVLSEKLLLKLELLLERANAAGIAAPTFQVLSGFRSPWYNAGIGRPRYSRHIYGDAADIFVDNDGDGRMDDLNRDGRVDVTDAGMLLRLVEQMDGSADTEHLIGGLGQYPTTSNHGPFIHVDTREYRARW
jgi:hypothetical protein